MSCFLTEKGYCHVVSLCSLYRNAIGAGSGRSVCSHILVRRGSSYAENILKGLVHVKESLLFKLEKMIFRFIGDIKWGGIFHPFWLTINASTFRLKGKHYRDVDPLIQPGDILIRRFEGYVDKFLIPGWWNHAGMYVGEVEGKQHKVVHAISDGVVVDDLIDFMRTDHLIILRAPEGLQEEAIRRATAAIGSDYDFAFDFNETLRFSCTELVSHCYPGHVDGKKRFGRVTVVADDIVNTPTFKVVWDSREK